eukprot:UN03786
MNYIVKSANRCLKLCASNVRKYNTLRSLKRIPVIQRRYLYKGYYTHRIYPIFCAKRFHSGDSKNILRSACAPGTFITKYYFDVFGELLVVHEKIDKNIAQRFWECVAYVCRGDGVLVNW